MRKFASLGSRATMGRLAKTVSNALCDSVVEESFSLLVNKRNWLAHSFFVDGAVLFSRDDGRVFLDEKLALINEEFFRSLNRIITVLGDWLGRNCLESTFNESLASQSASTAAGAKLKIDAKLNAK